MRDILLIETNDKYESVDIGSCTDIVLHYKSNIFSDISKIVSNNSYTIKLPMTARNQLIMDRAEFPMYNSMFTHKRHLAQYFKSGLQIVKDALVTLIESNTHYEIAFIWGNISRFADMIDKGASLNELSGDDYIIWNQSISNYNSGNFLISYADYGIRSVVSDINSNIWFHPCVKVSWILDKIQSDNGIVLIFPDNKKEIINKLMVPLISKEDTQTIMNDNQIPFYLGYINGMLTTSEQKGIDLIFNGDNTVSKYVKAITVTSGGWSGTKGYEMTHDSENALIQGNVTLIIPKENTDTRNMPIRIIKRLSVGAEEQILEIFPSYSSGDETNYTLSYSFGISFSVLKSDIILFALGRANKVTGSLSYHIDSFISMTLNPRGEVYKDERYPIQHNLPDIKQIDFLKAICNMLGLFAIPVEGKNNVIRFATMDIITDNKSKAYDWTNKIVKQRRINSPRTVVYSIQDFAQKNYLNYKEDDSVKGRYDGFIDVSDDSLEKIKDMVTLPFAASDTARNGMASIPIYSYKEESGGTLKLEYSKCEPRIVIEENDNGLSRAVFTGLSFKELINTHYRSYQRSVRTPKVITEYIQLSNYELMSIDLTIPAYLGQYARYYAIIDIKAKDNNICECKLLQL